MYNDCLEMIVGSTTPPTRFLPFKLAPYISIITEVCFMFSSLFRQHEIILSKYIGVSTSAAMALKII
jgi:hypothetical protein